MPNLEQNLSADYQSLRQEVSYLQGTIASLQLTIEDLGAKILALQAINAKLTDENNQLKERLGLNSTNSSLPPSRDLYAFKRKNKPKSPRKPGGQPGHTARLYQPRKADEILDCLPANCSCGHPFQKIDKYTVNQKIDIPPIKPHVTEYRKWHGKCPACKKVSVAPLPAGVKPDLLDNHAKAIICTLNGMHANSKREEQTMLENIFNLPLSLGLISNTAKRVNKSLEASYQDIKNQITDSNYLHIDETGHRSQGKKGWSWVFTNHTSTLLHLSKSRGKKVLQEVLGGYDGYVISDRYSSYNYFKAANRQICWSHLKRDFERFAHSKDPILAAQGKRLVKISQQVCFLYKRARKEGMSQEKLEKQANKYQQEVRRILKDISGLKERKQAQGVVRNLENRFDRMWLFVKEPEVEPTNNLAERQIRKYVTYRKKLLFTWSEWGNGFVERILSLFLTCRLSKLNPFTQLALAINSS